MTAALTTTCSPGGTSDAPGLPPVPDVRRTPALLVGMILAEHGINALSCADAETSYARIHNVVDRVVRRVDHAEIMSWRERVSVPEQQVRWEGACRAVRTYFAGELPGAETMPTWDELISSLPGTAE